jgi:Fe-S-cluster containining protein
MLLSAKDIERLEMKGYDRDFFVRFDSEGYAALRNYRGFCVFYDAEKKRCKVRAHRPLGCRIYPVIYDEGKGIVVDAICPSRGSVTEKQKAKCEFLDSESGFCDKYFEESRKRHKPKPFQFAKGLRTPSSGDRGWYGHKRLDGKGFV